MYNSFSLELYLVFEHLFCVLTKHCFIFIYNNFISLQLFIILLIWLQSLCYFSHSTKHQIVMWHEKVVEVNDLFLNCNENEKLNKQCLNKWMQCFQPLAISCSFSSWYIAKLFLTLIKSNEYKEDASEESGHGSVVCVENPFRLSECILISGFIYLFLVYWLAAK